MTEASDDGNCLVRVQAQVMTRDDSSGGWVPLSGGGLANVSVRRRVTSSNAGHLPGNSNGTGGGSSSVAVITPSSSTPSTTTGIVTSNQSLGSSSTSPPTAAKKNHEYFIYGRRMKDQSVVLSCTIKKDFKYHKVMPTFHHWCTGEKKFGLTFQTAADARAFDKGVRSVLEELLEANSIHQYYSTGLTDTTLRGDHPDGGDDGVFMAVNLPADPPDLRQSSDPPRGIVRVPNYHSQCGDPPDPHKSTSIHYISPSVKVAPTHHHPLDSSGDVSSDNYPYVQFTTLNHDYLYPVIDDHKGDRSPTERRNSSGSLKKPDIIISQPTKSSEKQRNARLRCKYCQEVYSEHQNPRGSCEYAPDPVKKGIAKVSCLLCAQCMLYHCMSDAEGDFAQNPCSCSAEDGCGRRWFGLALLSLIVPCLWLYPPLRAIHWCGMACGICGGRHHPME
ncbi:sprouty-related, EVH1 domain-containing protein 3 isoform X2 [Chelonus insularis]|uniref:sprouty-related, EVH1 domain-containing protein 3 isoform X2 n=1 Tax=Chelonus insularis TaxID=460826 RepID=UPI00158D1ACF|nr:sprouty-related, EVH1 domain-containing protein 3 isoform X2 [Chelonus insularis]